MKRLTIFCLFWVCGTSSAQHYATVADVRPYYTKADCQGCMMPVFRGYVVRIDYKGSSLIHYVTQRPQVGDKWEVRYKRLYGDPIPPTKDSDYHGRFPSNMSDNESNQNRPSR